MSKSIISTIITLIFVVILFATNPQEHQLKEHIKQNLKDEAVQEGGFIGAVKEAFAGPQSWLMGFTIERKNLYLFSIYEVDGADVKHKYVGLLGTFIEI